MSRLQQLERPERVGYPGGWWLLVTVLLSACAGTGRMPVPVEAVPERSLRMAELHAEMGIQHLRHGEIQAAAQAFERALLLDPQSVMAHLGAGNLRERLGDPSRAVEHYQQVLRYEPGNPFALTHLGAVYCRSETGVEFPVQPVQQEQPMPGRPMPGQNQHLQEQQAQQEQGLGWLQEALRVLESDPAERSVHAVALYSAGACAYRLGQLEPAETWLRAALELHPTYPEALLDMAALSLDTQRPLLTRAFLSRLEALDQLPERGWRLCQQAEQLLGNLEEAMRCSRRFRSEIDNRRNGFHWNEREAAYG